MKNYLCVFGHTAVDVILQTDSLPEPNTSTAVKKRTVQWGGTGANIAKAASDMNVKTSLSSFVGEDFPKNYEKSLKQSGVDLRGLNKLENGNTPTCWIVTEPDGDQMALMDQGAMENIQEREVDKKYIKNSEITHIGTGEPEYYRKVMRVASKFGKTIAFDPAQELKYVYEPNIFKELLEMSDIFFCNENEAKLALEYLDSDNIEDFLEYVEYIIVTKGSSGSSLYYQGTKKNIPLIEAEKIIDPTGAGDCYRAGFYAGMARDYDIYECCLIGAARGSFALESYGPQDKIIRWENVIDRLESSGHGIIN